MTETFPDRRQVLFGREADVRHLVERARRPGITALVARPLMGKTWTLHEVARRLLEEGDCLVGYHESKASESSHLLHAVSDLYARWLADSSLREQAISLWQRHKSGLVPRVGQMAGALFGQLADHQLAKGSGAIVRAAFDGLADAQKDLLSGGVTLAPLPYDQALSLTKLVSGVSQRRVVLILDAWEKSPSIRHEAATLEAFLKHLGDWPHAHIFVAVRDPELDSAAPGEVALRSVDDLRKLSRAVAVHHLPPMQLDEPAERDRLMAHVRAAVPAASEQSSDDLVAWIDAYPGVIDFWTSLTLQTVADLKAEAGNAQALRYLELDRLLSGLPDELLPIAARLAFLPRLDGERWTLFARYIVVDSSPTAVEELVDLRLLADEPFPTYGHDTRHAAARRWFIESKLPKFRRIAQPMIDDLASQMTGIGEVERPFFEALAACYEVAARIDVGPSYACLIDAARSQFGDVEEVLEPAFAESLAAALRRNPRAEALVARGLLRRAESHNRVGDAAAAIADFNAILGLNFPPPEVAASALYNLGNAERERGDLAAAISHYDMVIRRAVVPADLRARAHLNRGNVKRQSADVEAAIEDYDTVCQLAGAPADTVATALYNRGVARAHLGDLEGELRDYTAAINLTGAPTNMVAQALFNRGTALGMAGRLGEAVRDFDHLVGLAAAPAEQVAKVLNNRGRAKELLGDVEGAIADYRAAAIHPDAAADVRQLALVQLQRLGGRTQEP